MAADRPDPGRDLKAFFTIGAGLRYAGTMLLLALAILSADASVNAPVTAQPERQARATARIVRPASLRVGDSKTLEGVPLRRTVLRQADGVQVPAMLAEFQ